MALVINGYKVNITPGKVAILRRLSHGPIRNSDLRLLDQRPLRALFLDGAFTLNAKLDAQITPIGWDAYKSVFTSKPAMRSHLTVKRPTFIEAVDYAQDQTTPKKRANRH